MLKCPCIKRIKSCFHKPYCCFCKHIKTYKKQYVLGLFGSFALVKLFFLLIGFFGSIYESPHYASATGPSPVDPSTFCSDNLAYVGVPRGECVGAISLYNSTDGQNRNTTTNRLTKSNICDRHGIDCVGNNITAITLSNNNLVGYIPLNLQLLGKLSTMDISHNKISSIVAIPYTNLTQLTTINASYNLLNDTGGLDSLIDLEKLQNLDLSHNAISFIPYSYDRLRDTMLYIDLSYNKIRRIEPITDPGSDFLISLKASHNIIDVIPKSIANLKNVQHLDLSKNLINDKTVANAAGVYNSLISLDLAHNLITRVPGEFLQFRDGHKLQSLDLSYNFLPFIQEGTIEQITTLLFLNLSNNQLDKLIELKNLDNLQILDYGFNRLEGELYSYLGNLLEVRTTLTNLSFRHNNLRGAIPEEFTLFTLLQNGGNRIDYNRLDEHKVDDGHGLLTFLNQKFVKTSNQEKYFNTHRRDQYRFFDITLGGSLNTAGDIHPGDEIQITLEYKNNYDRNSHNLDISLYDVPGAYTIQAPTDGYAMIKEGIFDDSDPCKKDLRDNTAGIYLTTLNNRASANGHSSFFSYLTSDIRDYDLYAVRGNDPANPIITDPYTASRGSDFIKRIDGYDYDAFQKSFQKSLFSRLFDIDLNDLAILGCGTNGKNVTSFDDTPLAANTARTKTFTIKIDPGFVGSFDITALIESDNRLYIEKDPGNNRYSIPIKVVAIPLDTDSDGIFDEDDNCPLVANPGQENMDEIQFTKTDRADYTISQNQDCINPNVCITRANQGPLYNAATQTSGDVYNNCSANPDGTERAIGTCANKNSLTFGNLFDINGCYPPEMLTYDMCLHITGNDTYYDVNFTSRTQGPSGNPPGSGGGFSYKRIPYIDGDTAYLGDACDCTDSQCTTGNDYTGNLICSPVDPVCPMPLPIGSICSGYQAYLVADEPSERNASVDTFTTLINNNGYFNLNNFPYLRYFLAVSYYHLGSTSSAFPIFNSLLTQQGLPPLSDPSGIPGAIISLDPIFLSGPVTGLSALRGIIYNQGMDDICPICGNSVLEGNEQCDGANLNNQSCSSFGYSQGTLSCTASCTINTSNCSNPSGGGGGGGGGGTNPMDVCPNGDFSSSYYDHTCGTPPTTPTIPPSHGAAQEEPSLPSSYDTTHPITRLELAQIVVPFALEVLNISRDTTKSCIYTDTNILSTAEKNILKLSCELNLMGVEPDGYTPKPIYKPMNIVSFNEFGTVLSRLLYDGAHNIDLTSPKQRYEEHMKALKNAGLISTPIVTITEAYVQSMLNTIKNNLDLVERSDAGIHGSANTTTNVTTTSATIISDILKSFLNTFQRFILQRK